MKRTSSTIAVITLSAGVVTLTAGTAAARVPADPPVRQQAGVEAVPGPVQVPVQVPVDDSRAEGIQAGASALGGAGITLGAVWLYRRRNQVTGRPTAVLPSA